jgi:hypothetical protein
MEACYGGTDVMERSCALARGIDINSTVQQTPVWHGTSGPKSLQYYVLLLTSSQSLFGAVRYNVLYCTVAQ